jgi:hypothetical protein
VFHQLQAVVIDGGAAQALDLERATTRNDGSVLANDQPDRPRC